MKKEPKIYQPKTIGNTWSVIPESHEALIRLATLVHTPEVLRQNSFQTELLTDDNIWHTKRRCRMCEDKVKGLRVKHQESLNPKKDKKNEGDNYKVKKKDDDDPKDNGIDDGEVFKDLNGENEKPKEVKLLIDEIQEILENIHSSGEHMTQKQRAQAFRTFKSLARTNQICVYHETQCHFNLWLCCDKPKEYPACVIAANHTPDEYDIEQLKSRWFLHCTPENKNALSAVAIDCEMGVAFDSELELIRISMVDFFTGEVLVSSLVWPNVTLSHCNTAYSGVEFRDLQFARNLNKAIMGCNEAREAVWEYIGPDTIVVLHGGANDLKALKWIHLHVIDIRILEVTRERVLEKTSLQYLTNVRLNRQIQQERGHDSLEDAFACRELAIWYCRESELKDMAWNVERFCRVCQVEAAEGHSDHPVHIAKRQILLDKIKFMQEAENTFPVLYHCEACDMKMKFEMKDKHELLKAHFKMIKLPTPEISKPEEKVLLEEDMLPLYYDCVVCNVRVLDSKMDSHIEGKIHQGNVKIRIVIEQTNKRMAEMELAKQEAASTKSEASSDDGVLLGPEIIQQTPVVLFTCTTCRYPVPIGQRQLHYSSAEHKKKQACLDLIGKQVGF